MRGELAATGTTSARLVLRPPWTFRHEDGDVRRVLHMHRIPVAALLGALLCAPSRSVSRHGDSPSGSEGRRFVLRSARVPDDVVGNRG
jgi:hypothetical protein